MTVLLSVATLIAAVVLLLATTRTSAGFLWTDAATFALNGKLVLDYLQHGFPSNPMTFAQRWFLNYPAITISLYPPLFPLAEAAMFRIFGFSNFVAQATVSAFTAVAAYGCWRLARTALPSLAAAMATLILFSTPIMLVWSRQIMMEIPSLAFLLVGAACLSQYQAGRDPWRLYLAVIMVLLSVYTKQTSIFAAAAFALALLAEEGMSILRNRTVWIAAGVGALCLVPLAVFTILVSPDAIEVARRHDLAGPQTSRFAVDALTAYARALPGMVGWLPLAATVGYVVLVAVKGWSSIAERRLAILMAAWFGAEYLFVTFIGHFEARYGLSLAVPVALAVPMLLVRVVPRRWSEPSALAIGWVAFASALILLPLQHTGSYAPLANRIVSEAAQDDVVFFQGNDSKSLAFELQAASPTPKVFLIRAEKAILAHHYVTDPLVTDSNVSAGEIEKQLDDAGVAWVVWQSDFWTDQPSIQKLQSIVYSGRFKPVAEFQIDSDLPSSRATLTLFKSVNATTTRPDVGQLLRISNRR